MSQQMYAVTFRAEGEVRDAEGNLVEPVTAESTQLMSEDDLRAHGITDEQIAQIKEQNT